MFFSRSKKHLLVSLLMSCFISSCNKDEFYAMVSTVEGRDAYCSLAADQAMCETRSDLCQSSYEDSSDETLPPVFSACISNPIVEPAPTPGDGTTSPTPGDGTTSPTPGDGTTSPTPGDGTTSPTPGDGTTSPTPGDGTTSPTPGDGTTNPPVVNVPPTVEEAYNANCTNVDSDDLWIKNTMKKDQLVSRVVKVKVCHQTGNLSMHTILIACPALRPHIEHHADYIGACR